LLQIKKFLCENLFPREFTCDICGLETYEGNLCPDCKKTVKFNDGTTCPVCGRKTVRPEICIECKAKPPEYKKAVSALVYVNGGLRLLSKFKNGFAYLKEYFADLLAVSVKDLPEADCMVYVPMTEKSQKIRGYNQTKLLAHALSKRISVPVIDGAVIKIKKNKAQKGLTRTERAENVKGCFEVKNREAIKDKNVLVLDDILTTGATADEVCRLIKSAGAKTVYFASIASVEYKIIPDAENIKKKRD